MHSITLVHMDLNLLTALDALLEEGSVGAAADRLGLSQPAMSRTLARIRQATGDPVLVRSGRLMLPTAYAEGIRDEVHQLAVRAQAVLAPMARADISALERTFTVQFNDVIAGALLPRLAARVAAAAPGVRLRVLGEADTAAGELRQGKTDLQVTGAAPRHADVRAVTVATDRLVTFGGRDLPSDPATLDGFAALPHVVISRRGRQHDRIDDLLAGHGRRRRVVVTVPTLAAAVQTATAAGLVMVAPERMTSGQVGPELRPYALPLKVPAVPAVLAWHARHERDSAHRWLRGLITDVLTSIAGPEPAVRRKAAR
jgi:DNA-binding transcriptional LysR family regulator